LHFFFQPEHAGGYIHNYLRLPKRKAKLELVTTDCYVPGWGLWFQEEFSWAKAFVVETACEFVADIWDSMEHALQK
jgi:hypothetical protein